LNAELTVISEAERPEVGLDTDAMKLIDIESRVIPYGNSKKAREKFSAFKPVTHGQLKDRAAEYH